MRLITTYLRRIVSAWHPSSCYIGFGPSSCALTPDSSVTSTTTSLSALLASCLFTSLQFSPANSKCPQDNLKHAELDTMTLTMNGDHATVVVHGDFNDFGSGVQGMKHKHFDLRHQTTDSHLDLCLISAVESKYVDVTPPPCSSRFTGQKKYLDQLQECFTPRSCDSQSNVPSGSQQGKNPGIECSEETRRCVLLHGIGGVGKTQVALKFAENASKR